MDILLTGASGFVGKNLLRHKEPGWHIYGLYFSSVDFERFLRKYMLTDVEPIRCDLTSPGQVANLARRIPSRFDAIVHLAANGDPGASTIYPLDDLLRGVVATVNLLSVFSCRKFVYFSSGAVYDGNKGLVGPETRLNPTLPYAVSKLGSEQYIKAFRKRGQISEYIILRFFGAFGPFEPDRKIYTKIVKWSLSADDEPFVIRGDGHNLIDAMYVDDAIRGVKKVLNSGVSDEIVDFGTGDPITINNLFDRACRAFGRPEPKVKHTGGVPEYNEFYVSPRKMIELFDFYPETSLEKGLFLLREHLLANG